MNFYEADEADNRIVTNHSSGQIPVTTSGYSNEDPAQNKNSGNALVVGVPLNIRLSVPQLSNGFPEQVAMNRMKTQHVLLEWDNAECCRHVLTIKP